MFLRDVGCNSTAYTLLLLLLLLLLLRFLDDLPCFEKNRRLTRSPCLCVCVSPFPPIVARQWAVYVSVWPPQMFRFLCGPCRIEGN
jgi:hypothetical protein